MSKIESILDKLATVATLKLTEKEILEVCSSDNNNKFLGVIDSCKFANKENLQMLYSSKNSNSFEDQSKQQGFNFPQFFICCTSQLCDKELSKFKICQTKNSSNLSKCTSKLIKLESCMNDHIIYFYDSLCRVKDI